MLRHRRRAPRLALAVLLAVAPVGPVVLSACDDGGEARAAYVAAMAEADREAIEEGLEGELTRMSAPDEETLKTISTTLDEAALVSLETYGCTPEELCRHVLARLQYEVGPVEVTGEETAVAEVTIENVDLSAALASAHERLVGGDGAKRLEKSYGSGSETSIMRAAMDVIFEEVDTCPETNSTRVRLALTKDSDLWVIEEADYMALLSAALGGIELTGTYGAEG